MAFTLPLDDLRNIARHAERDLVSLRKASIFLTGCTNFFGAWLIEALLWANFELDLDLTLVVLSRHPERFFEKMPHLSRHKALTMLPGDICSFSTTGLSFSHAVHGSNVAPDNSGDWPVRQMETAVLGTRRLLEASCDCGCQSVLFLSSGAAYRAEAATCVPANGNQEDNPSEGFRERQNQAADNLLTLDVYGLTKRFIEVYITALGAAYDIRSPLARCFAFAGPYMPLDGIQAFGNFVCDAMAGRDIVIKGDGTPIRSFMYAADLVIWLLALLVRGRHGVPYNIGSKQAASIRQVAETVAKAVPEHDINVRVLREGAKAETSSIYLPDTSRCEDELGLSCTVGLEQAVEKTISWLRAHPNILGTKKRKD